MTKQETLDRYCEDLQSGRTFVLHSQSSRSIRCYEPPLNRSDWGHVMIVVGDMARESDALAQVATSIRVNLYGTRSLAMASIYDAMFKAVNGEYDDVIGRTGPEPGRPSSHRRKFKLSECISLAYWAKAMTAPLDYCVPGVGWALEALRDKNNVFIHESCMKHLRR